jgi:ribosome biogenesis GTPase
LSAPSAPLAHGQVVSVHGRHYQVELRDGTRLHCFPRGKKSLVACGDRVAVIRTTQEQGVIEAVDPRRSLLYRSDRRRQKLIAANVTQMAIVLAAVPSFHEELLNRCLVAAEHQRIRPLIVLNKFDLVDESRRALSALSVYQGLGYAVVTLIAKRDVSPLLQHLEGETSVLVGQSGMGKSTIINALRPDAGAKVGDVSLALDSGRHTTTYARLYWLDARSALIDSPGLQEFGLAHVPLAELPLAFPEFRSHLGQCRFHNCRHVSEPGCAIEAACAHGEVSAKRLDVYRALAREIGARKTY